MKQIKVAVRKKGSRESVELNEADLELKQTLERLAKKGINPMQMCHKLNEHGVSFPGEGEWTYDHVMEECQRLKVDI
ncbi:hypothetical protein [Endozoicomonas ascidiicola]|uniref:hypothetical protein n=1 Tax=Endozoicomonas ascidiicola TaxID=1698521 RepID=UPI0008347DD3|nr:hypothetical protein [Endozoicomonas ascidiicola]